MPLVVPGITGTSGDKTEEWTNKLVGKKLSEGSSDEVVREPGSSSMALRLLNEILPSHQVKRVLIYSQNFCKKDLPEECRVIEPGMMVTKDFKPDRLNVHLKEDGTVSHVQHG